MKAWELCTWPERIKRWEKAAEVLRGLPVHVKKEHWDMGAWGEETECGTIACAAGHCGMDPWFKRRGLSLFFKDAAGREIAPCFGIDVGVFFGEYGTSKIFRNTSHRSVRVVVSEIKHFVRLLKTMQKKCKAEPHEAHMHDYSNVRYHG